MFDMGISLNTKLISYWNTTFSRLFLKLCVFENHLESFVIQIERVHIYSQKSKTHL